MTNLKTNIFHSMKLRSAWMVLVLFSGSVLGGMMFASITKPKEACAQCVAVPIKSGPQTSTGMARNPVYCPTGYVAVGFNCGGDCGGKYMEMYCQQLWQ